MKPRKVFWITQKWPFPAEDGARRATFHLVKGLTALGTRVELIAIITDDENPDVSEATRSLGVSSVRLVRRKKPRHLVNILTRPLIPLTFAPFATSDVREQMEKVLADASTDDVVVFDGLHAAASLLADPNAMSARTAALPLVYRAHNVESSLWKQGAQRKRNPLLSALLWYQGKLVHRFESDVCHRVKLTGTVSELDAENFHKAYGNGFKTESVPIGIELKAAGAEGESFPSKRNLLFIGRLDWPPNRDGLRWLLENVWSEAVGTDPDLEMTIAGAGDGEWLKPYLSLPNIKFLGRVAEVGPAYQSAAASLVPVFFGSGTRVKAIEASSFRRPCISTAIGIEGIGLDPDRSYYNAETKEEWLRVIRGFSIEDAKSRGQAARTVIEEKFDPVRIADRLLKSFDKNLSS